MPHDQHRIFALAAAMVCLACLLAGCGGQSLRQAGVDGYVYLPETLELGSSLIAYRHFTVAGDSLYYLEDSHTIQRVPLANLDAGLGLSGGERVLAASNAVQAVIAGGGAEEGLLKTLRAMPADGSTANMASVLDYAIEPDGSIYCLLSLNQWLWPSADSSNGQTPAGELQGDSGQRTAPGLLCRQSPDGDMAYWMELPRLSTAYAKSDWLALDGQGGIYVLTADSILAVDANGKATGSIPTEPGGSVGRLLKGNGGQVYYVGKNREVSRLTKGENLQIVPFSLPTAQMEQEIYQGTDCLLKASNDSLFRYDEATNSLIEILRWNDSEVFGTRVTDVVQIDADRLLVTEARSDSSRNMVLTKTPAGNIPEREILVIASLSPSVTLRSSIVAFNRSNEKYRVLLQTYDMSADAEGAAMRLNASLMSRDTPDLLDLTELDVFQYADKGLLEDLNPYIGQNTAGYLDNMLDGYTIDGKLISIPRYFALPSMWGVTPESCGITNWTVPELMALTARCPDKKLLRQGAEYLLTEFCVPYYLEQFVDWEKGTCSFDSAQFRVLLDWVDAQEKKEGQTQDVLLEYRWIRYFDEYLHCLLRYGDTATMYGYPSVDGTGIHKAYPWDALSIPAASGNKDAAWEFLRYFLTDETDMLMETFSTRRDLLEEEYRYAVTAGEEPRTLYIGGDTPVEYYAVGSRQADTVMQVLKSADFTPRNSAEDGIVRIVWEEAQYFLAGSKSAETVSLAIQNRAALLLQEQKR